MRAQQTFDEDDSTIIGEAVSGRTIGQIFQEIVSRTGEILRSEFQLAAAELKQDLAVRARAAAFIGAAALLLTMALGFLLLAAVYLISLALPAWLSALIVALAVGVIGGILLYAGIAKMKQRFKLDMTTRTAEDNIRWLKNLAK
jgi:hypothetical protein